MVILNVCENIDTNFQYPRLIFKAIPLLKIVSIESNCINKFTKLMVVGLLGATGQVVTPAVEMVHCQGAEFVTIRNLSMEVCLVSVLLLTEIVAFLNLVQVRTYCFLYNIYLHHIYMHALLFEIMIFEK